MITPAQVRMIAVACAFLALLALCGWQEVRVQRAKAALSTEAAAHLKTQRDDAKALADSVEAARKTESGLRTELETIQTQAAQENENAKAREDALADAVRSGARRLSVLAKCPAADPASGSSASAGGGGASLSRAELDPAAGERILAIGRDGDRNTRERNTCVQAYESVRSKLNSLNQKLSDGGQQPQ